MKYMYCIVILFASFFAFAQDSIVGIYNNYSLGYNELIFMAQGTFRYTDRSLNLGKPFQGKWVRINDSTIHATIDTVINVNLDSNKNFSSFYCIQTHNHLDVIWCHFQGINDTSRFKFWLQKNGTLYDTDSIKYERKGSDLSNVSTFYHPNGKISEIIEYSKGVKDGIYLKYDQNGRLLRYQNWKKGRKMDDTEYEYDW